MIVRLKAEKTGMLVKFLKGFNSMIVRLKAIVPMIRDFPLPSFNSMIVRLKVCIRGSVGRQSEGVSIL